MFWCFIRPSNIDRKETLIYKTSCISFLLVYMGCFTVNVRCLITTSKHCLIFDSFFIESCGKDKTFCVSFLLVYKGFFTVNVRGLIKTSKHCRIFDSFLLKVVETTRHLVSAFSFYIRVSLRSMFEALLKHQNIA